MPITRVCFVCLGNICRSPTAEGVFRHLVAAAEREHEFEIDSAGTAAYHEGERPDRRSLATARARGVDLPGRARQFRRGDFDRFDHVLAMDLDNQRALLRLAPNEAARAKVSLLRSFDPASPSDAEVPDPYYGGPDGFDRVFEICMAACQGLLTRLSPPSEARRDG
ncbi:low molecular weight protein-tyrosine-phosphatase [Paraliomyxa miuraensis]|uniref:low molecular weight protein-tyrosine-phosphatase n=1 Tax=Paraliomyxa miuraensis TaxID=376150 RepID=UPI00224CF00C|nr:low molecular weight protein-tyrosine-phosphatase [Paraliomyxa miuraensis]MCX4240766.1 low molecular weight phosphotyrosine protein phosphatase [Paraliomyxa miuraensis]